MKKRERTCVFQFYAMICAVSMASNEGLSEFSCISCTETLEVDNTVYTAIGDDCKPIICQPEETRCVATKYYAPGIGTLRYRSCEILDIKDLEDGCQGMGCEKDGFGYHCKQTCNDLNCNDDKFADFFDQVNQLKVNASLYDT